MKDPSPQPPADDSEPNPQIGQKVHGNGNQVIGWAIGSTIVGKIFNVNIFLRNILPPPNENEIARSILLNDKVKPEVMQKLGSLHKILEIELGLEDCRGLVQQHDEDCENAKISREALPQGTQVTDIFDQTGVRRRLAIFGEPGSGKTNMLLKLTEEIIRRTEQDLRQPSPVVFNLSSWGQKPQTIKKWLVQELYKKI
jgi:hypothetical protein